MKKLISFLLLPLQLIASDCCDTDYGINVAGEWLYFMPSFDQNAMYWVGSDDTSVNQIQTRAGEEQKYYSAFRVEAGYQFCNQINELLLRYTNFHSSYISQIDENGMYLGSLAQISGAIGQATIEREYNYYSITGLYTLYKGSICNFHPSISAGVHFLSLHIAQQSNFLITSESVNQFVKPDMKSWALGPSVEFNGLYDLFNCFAIKGRFLFALLADQSRPKFFITGNTSALSGSSLQVSDNPDLWHVVPSMETRLGLEFKRSFCGVGVEIEGGYELIDAWDLVSIMNMSTINAGFSAMNWSDFTLTGPFVRVNLTY